ncbi:MAG: hypothetical protein CBC24_05385 [Candidatus Pelagibacter sp. TMED64]|nr:hypothetical protein [Candidatus Pelagibacter sp.]OUU65559.1 MAG: hypothetical protein CBC24_05385 [Candidatus Pelagibacter sp. TMED64]|tara:strand:- start:7324 stop:8151 length:828 start_codon:yes stop_codon:yes gene_type:complete
MIIWIASYPKSGNTWMRSLISSYFFSSGEDFNFDLLKKIPLFPSNKQFSPLINLNNLSKEPLKISDYWNAAQSRLNLNNKKNFLKTHNACASHNGNWFTNKDNTLAYIYLVRDPRAVVCSNAFHSNITLDQSVKDLMNDNLVAYNGEFKLVEMTGSWKTNYLSWKKKKDFKGIIIKYEDLLKDTTVEFKKVLVFLKNFIDIDINEKKIEQCVKNCKFENLEAMEKKYGFEEAVSKKFFNIGKKDSWRSKLNIQMINKIEKELENEMKELGYLNRL